MEAAKMRTSRKRKEMKWNPRLEMLKNQLKLSPAERLRWLEEAMKFYLAVRKFRKLSGRREN